MEALLAERLSAIDGAADWLWPLAFLLHSLQEKHTEVEGWSSGEPPPETPNSHDGDNKHFLRLRR